MATMEAAKK